MIGWPNGFAMMAAEGGLPSWLFKDPGDVATWTMEGRGWMRASMAEATERFGPRLEGWDLRSSIRDATDQGADWWEGTVQDGSQIGHYRVEATVRGGEAVSLTMWAPLLGESPFRFVATAGPDWPATGPSIGPADAAEGDGLAQAAHRQVATWIDDYRGANLGRVPERVDADSLALQRGLSPWPSNAWTGEPVAHADASGHFLWSPCGADRGRLVGFGWDRVVLDLHFGAGCPDALTGAA